MEDSDEEFHIPLSFDEQDDSVVSASMSSGKIPRIDSHEIQIPQKRKGYVSPESRRTTLETSVLQEPEILPPAVDTVEANRRKHNLSPATIRIHHQMIPKETSNGKPPLANPPIEKKFGSNTVFLKSVSQTNNNNNNNVNNNYNANEGSAIHEQKDLPTFKDKKAYFESRSPPQGSATVPIRKV